VIYSNEQPCFFNVVLIINLDKKGFSPCGRSWPKA
jgi:hypothetical protein